MMHSFSLEISIRNETKTKLRILQVQNMFADFLLFSHVPRNTSAKIFKNLFYTTNKKAKHK